MCVLHTKLMPLGPNGPRPFAPGPLGRPFGPGPAVQAQWTRPSGPGPLGQAHWARPIEPGPLDQAHWAIKGPGPLGQAHCARLIGPGPMGQGQPNGPGPLGQALGQAYWARPIGPGPLAHARHQFCVWDAHSHITAANMQLIGSCKDIAKLAPNWRTDAQWAKNLCKSGPEVVHKGFGHVSINLGGFPAQAEPWQPNTDHISFLGHLFWNDFGRVGVLLVICLSTSCNMCAQGRKLQSLDDARREVMQKDGDMLSSGATTTQIGLENYSRQN